ncbi:MAG: alpha/beta hydrolase [Dyella sp.]|uniref:alpha/beta hydrolase n=1 Tax=Dyella sp. TaxID=1869338 RepID=UPI003F820E8A
MNRNGKRWWLGACLLLMAGGALAQTRGGWAERWRERQSDAGVEASLPAGTRLVRDVAYGSDPRQRFDVYAPAQALDAPVILMVHGGGWRRGDKAMPGVVANKVAYWVPRGAVVISVNYRMLPDTPPLEQARDVARALALAQRRAREWGGNPARFVLMGHSAGAHLVALLAARPELAGEQGARPWRGTVSLDSACLDVVQTMRGRHFLLYDEAFGANPADWLAVSPFQQLRAAPAPFLAVCSSRRRDSCPQAHAFVDKVHAQGSRGRALEEDLTHAQINKTLGVPSDYTTEVDTFLRSVW